MARKNLGVTRDRSGKFTPIYSDIKEETSKNGFTVFNDYEGRGDKNVVENNERNTGGLQYTNKDGNRRNSGHNYTTKGGARVRQIGGELTRRQRYYDVRVGLGLAGG